MALISGCKFLNDGLSVKLTDFVPFNLSAALFILLNFVCTSKLGGEEVGIGGGSS